MTEQAIPVLAAPATPPRYGLVVSARAPKLDNGTRWESGFAWNPESCDSAGIATRCDPGEIEIPDGVGSLTYRPVALWGGDKCSPWETGREWQARARRQLLASGPKQLANEFWSGTVAAAESYPNAYLTDGNADELSAGSLTLLDGLACLEQGLADRTNGTQGMIHATPSAVTLWGNGGALRREGGLILTTLDTIVVPDAGYDGSGPDGSPAAPGSVWAYGTGMVDVRRGSVWFVPDGDPSSLPNIPRSAVNRADNTVSVYAWQAAAATWDTCVQIAVELDLTSCGLDGS